MAVPSDVMTQLIQSLQSGMGTPQPSQQGGLMGAINAQLAPYGGAAGLGLSLMGNTSGATAPGAALAQGMQNAQQYQQKLTSQQIQNAQGLMQLRQAMIMQSLMNSAMQGGQGQATPQGAPQAAQGGTPSAPAGAYDASAGPALPQGSPLSSAAPPGAPQTPGFGVGDVSQIPIQGMNPRLAYVMALQRTGDPTAAAKEVRDQQYAIAQLQAKPQLAQLDTVIKSADPVTALRGNVLLKQAWMAGAPMAGLDPNDLSDPAKVRIGLTMGRNALASSVNLAPAEAPIALKKITLPDGRVAQVNPVTGKEDIEAPSPMEKVVGPDGKPTLQPTALTRGMTPYNQFSTATDEDLASTAQAIAKYQMAPPTGARMTSGNWPAIMRMVRQINPDYDATQYTAKNKAYTDFTSGTDGKTVQSLSVALSHLDVLDKASQGLKNGQFQTWNQVSNWVGQKLGQPGPVTYDAARQIVSAEMTKAVVGAHVAEGDRRQMESTWSRANSPEQFGPVSSTMKALLSGQLQGFQRRYQKATGRNDFSDLLSPEAQALMPQTSGPVGVGQSQTIGGFKVTRVQ